MYVYRSIRIIPPSPHPIHTELSSVASLLGVQPQMLQQGLTLRTYASERGEAVQAPCSAAAVSHTLRVLAKRGAKQDSLR